MGEIGERHHVSHENGGADEIDISGLTGATEIVDTPADGETTKGISSNWAYDHKNDPDGHGNSIHPWEIYINTFHTPKSHINWNINTVDSAQLLNGWKLSSGLQNDEITWDVVIAKGTWNIEILTYKGTDQGIFSIQLDSVEKGTIDGYSSAGMRNQIGTITGILIATTGKYELKIKMTSKNLSSTSYVGAISSIGLLRTA